MEATGLAPWNVTMGPGKYCCHVCARNLDSNGMFPEDYASLTEEEIAQLEFKM